ncbi:MAG: N-acetylmuramoyl-L-alanine amidase [Eubacteriales bacterium]|jgi:N-acetyl-anhydromuramyl-L-alanine amidase AmpD|nr:N-acetylmuramoyl-L-alanine amidase [Eubacteriales bacterium]
MKPDIKWIGSPYFGYPRGTHGRYSHRVIAIVDHIMAGTLEGTDEWFNSPGNDGISAHFGVGKNGEIHQYVDINDVARHAGNVRYPSWPGLIPNSKNTYFINPNYYTIGIEHEGYSGDELTEAQYQATLSLHRWLLEELAIKPGPDTIIGHYRINSVQKAGCPGTGFPWARLLGELMNGNKKMEQVFVVEKGITFPALRFNGETYVKLKPYVAQDGKSVAWDEISKTATVFGGKLEEIKQILNK